MPSVSKKQQKFMGIVRAIQKGEAPSSKFSKKARDVAKSMKGKDVKKYASTKHKGLPNKVKSENKLFENPAAIAAGVRAAMQRAKEKELSAGGGKKVKVKTALDNKSHPQHKQAKGIIQRIKDKAKSMLSKSKKKKSEPKKQSKSDANFYARQFGGKTESVNKIEELKTKAKLTKDKVKKINKYMWSSPKRIVTQSQYNRMQKYNKMRKNGIDYVGTAIDGKLVFLPVVIESVNENKVEKVKVLKHLIKRGNNPKDAKKDVERLYNKVSKMYKNASPSKKAEIISSLSAYKTESKNEGFGGELSGSDKKKFEKARKENAEQLGYKLTGKSDVNESVNERMDKRQAGEMLKQLGGNRFIAMTGAKNFAVGPKGAGFKIGKNAKNVNYVRIDLDKGKDLYDMYFNFVSVRGVKLKSKVKGVYADQLQKMFTKHTGMYTSL